MAMAVKLMTQVINYYHYLHYIACWANMEVIIGGQYKVIKKVGSGAFGEIF